MQWSSITTILNIWLQPRPAQPWHRRFNKHCAGLPEATSIVAARHWKWQVYYVNLPVTVAIGHLWPHASVAPLKSMEVLQEVIQTPVEEYQFSGYFLILGMYASSLLPSEVERKELGLFRGKKTNIIQPSAALPLYWEGRSSPQFTSGIFPKEFLLQRVFKKVPPRGVSKSH